MVWSPEEKEEALALLRLIAGAKAIKVPKAERDPLHDDVHEAWEHYCELRKEHGLTTIRLTATRQSHLLSRIKEYGKEEVVSVLTKLFNPAYFWAAEVGYEGDKKDKMLLPKYAIRSAEQFERVRDAKPVELRASAVAKTRAAERASKLETIDGKLHFEGKRVFHSRHHVPVNYEGAFVIIPHGDPRLG